MENITYCIRRVMFFAVTYPIMFKKLSLEEANKNCKKLNDQELDSTYVSYQIYSETTPEEFIGFGK